MIIRGEPKDIEKFLYVCVSSKVSNILHLNGFYPKYFNGEKIWYYKNDKIIKFMEVNNLEWN
mgnify:CR=1 FL=1